MLIGATVIRATGELLFAGSSRALVIGVRKSTEQFITFGSQEGFVANPMLFQVTPLASEDGSLLTLEAPGGGSSCGTASLGA
jgi:hypothetical protein